MDVRLSIRQTPALIGIQTTPGTLQIRTQPGDLQIRQHPAELEVDAPRGELTIDSTDAWKALGKGPHLEWMNMIYTQRKEIFLQSIAKIVEDGNRMADITNRSNSFADVSYSRFWDRPKLNYMGEASVANVKIDYQMREPYVRVHPKKAEIDYTPHPAETNYQMGNVDVHIQRYHQVDMWVNQYDLYS